MPKASLRKFLGKVSSGSGKAKSDTGTPESLTPPSVQGVATSLTGLMLMLSGSGSGLKAADVRTTVVEVDESGRLENASLSGTTLSPFFIHSPPDESRLSAKRLALADSTRRLNLTISKRPKASLVGPISFGDGAMAAALQQAGTSPQCGAAAFGDYVASVVAEQHALRDGPSFRGKLARHAAKLYPLATIVLGVVSLAGDAAGFAPAKIAANGLSNVLVAALREHHRAGDVVQQLDSLTDYGPFLDGLRELVDSSALAERAADLFIAMTDYLRDALEYLDSPAPLRVLNQSLTEQGLVLEHARRRLDDQVMRDMQVAFFNWIETGQNSRVVESILGDTAYREKQAHCCSRRMPGTGQWVLDDGRFRGWREGNGEARVLCCVGLPGAGKTFTMSRIITELDDARRAALFHTPSTRLGIAHLYCTIANAEQQTAAGFLASVARQLVETPVTRPNPLMREAEKFHKLHLGRSLRMANHIELIKNLLRHLDGAFVLVDALDECIEYDRDGGGMRDTLVRALLGLDVKLLFTSRNVGAVDSLKEMAAQLGVGVQEMQMVPPPEDVESYIHWRIHDDAHGNYRLRKWIEGGKIEESEVVSQVLEKYSEVFNLARLQMDNLQKLRSTGEVRDALHKSGKTDEQFYDEAIRRIASSDNDGVEGSGGSMNFGFRVLGWVLRARRPLRFEELQDALAMRAYVAAGADPKSNKEDYAVQEQDVLTACQGLLVVESSKARLVAFAHATIEEYLGRVGLTRFPFGVDEDIATTCLAYLSDGVFAGGACADDEEFDSRMRENPFYGYAAQYWGEHVRGKPESALEKQLISFLKAAPLVLGSVQAKNIFDYGYKFHGRSQSYAKEVDGLWVAARVGLHATVETLLTTSENPKIDVRDDEGRTALTGAAAGGHESIVRLLLNHGADVSARDSHGRTPLHWAATENRVGVVDVLLSSGRDVDINVADADGCTPLHYATEEGYEAMVTALLGHGADPKKKNNSGWAPLHSAAPSEFLEVATRLLDAGAEVDSADDEGYTALHWLGSREHRAMVKLLLGRGARPDKKTSTGVTPIHRAAFDGVEEIVELLLDKAEDINPADIDGWTPLHAAAANGRDGMVRLLLERGAAPGTADGQGWTPLYVAWVQGHSSTVAVLNEAMGDDKAKDILAGLDEVEGTDSVRWTHIKYNVSQQNHYPAPVTRALEIIGLGRLDRVRALLAEGLDVNGEGAQDERQNRGWTPLTVAIQFFQLAVARLLLDNGADPNKRGGDVHKWTALHWAVAHRRRELVDLLLGAGADANVRDEWGLVPLHLAADGGHEELVALLLDKGAEVDAQFVLGLTPLQIAAAKGHEAAVKRLLDAGADVGLKDMNGRTAVMIAEEFGKEGVVALLRERAGEDETEVEGEGEGGG